MRTDDPIILQRLEEIERACEGLRMACGFPPLHETPETTASRRMLYECDRCSRMCKTHADLDNHILVDHELVSNGKN